MSYLNGYADRECLEALPKFRLPMLSNTGVYRAFEVGGDEMLPVAKGTVIVARYVESWATIQDGTPCIIVTQANGIEFRRVFSSAIRDSLTLHADNTAYEVRQVLFDEILEIWEAKSYVSSTFPVAEFSLDRLSSLVLDLQQQVANLKKH